MQQAVSPLPPPAGGRAEGLTLREAVQMAIAWHPSIGEALGQLYQQGEEVNIARSGYFPQISAGITTERRSSTNGSEDAFTLSASQMLYDFGRVSNSVDAASFGVERDQARVWIAMDTLARDTAQAVIEAQRFETMIAIANEQVAGLEELQGLATTRSELGASTRSDQIQAQSRVEGAVATLQQMQAQREVWLNTVQSLTGQSGPVQVANTFPEELTQSCALASDDFDNVPELLAAQAQGAEAQAIIAQTQSAYFPTLSLDAGFSQFLNQPNFQDDDNDVTIRLNLSSNLYQGGATSARRRAADFGLQTAQAARDSVLLDLSRNLREARSQTDNLARQFDTLEARARSISETQALYRQQYLALGTRSLLDLLNAEQEIHQSRFDQANTRYDLYRLQIDCLYNVADIRPAFGLNDAIVQGVSLIP
ncbi:TolC family outer membrane protein [Halomonas sp. wenzhen-202101]|uniref:TolC family outer membrane protein n=2 Tax=Halomonas dongshanensis TaxID=2890835 RepID=A0ABT2EEF1_9GAMM|nr:TolC family outer membrane protein [Halomonas dongshanensis]